MSLNIKNEETHRLVRELAERTGQSQTGAVEDAVRRRLAELERERQSVYDDLMQIARETAPYFQGVTGRELMDDLYDPETGLPR